MFVFWFFCGEAAKKPEHKGGLGLRPKGKKPLSFMRMGYSPSQPHGKISSTMFRGVTSSTQNRFPCFVCC
jgi:hypothetical protein